MRPVALLILFLVFFWGCEKKEAPEVVHIPDTNFLQALLAYGVDHNGDGKIDFDEAQTTCALKIGPSGIHDLSGIEAFIHLDSLHLELNPIMTLDVSGFSELRYLACRGCEITELDLTKNLNLEVLDCSGDLALDNYLIQLDLDNNRVLQSLDCSGNQISSLDLSGNPALKNLNCSRNRIAQLDVSLNTELTQLSCKNNFLSSLELSSNPSLVSMLSCGNRLITIDLSNNQKLKLIGIDNMPSLGEVCVWTTPFPPGGVKVLYEFSPNAYFTTTCIN